MARKKSLASWVSLYKSGKIKPIKLPKSKKRTFKQPKIKYRSSLKLRVGK